MPRVIKTVADLIDVLSRMEPTAVPISTEPPFTGVRITVCDPDEGQEHGKVMIHSPPRDKNDRLVGNKIKRGGVGSQSGSGQMLSASKNKPRMPRVISVGTGPNKRKFSTARTKK